MSDINERLDHLRELIQSPDFLEGKGLSNEVNIRIFCYDPKQEMTVQHFINHLKTDQSISCRIIECNLYQIFLSICEDMDITDMILDVEESDGDVAALEGLDDMGLQHDFVEKMVYEPHERGDVLLITGVGDVYPFMRAHTILNTLQDKGKFDDIPVLVMYPGEFDGYNLKLFNRLDAKDYYRAFNEV